MNKNNNYNNQVIGEPSKKLMIEISNIEKKRVKNQQELLGEQGLKEKGERLKKANEENGVCYWIIIIASQVLTIWVSIWVLYNYLFSSN